MMKIIKLLSIALITVAGISSCSDENSAIGSSIVNTELQIVVDSSFQELVTVQSVVDDKVVGRTTNQLIGRIEIPGYGKLKTDFLTQFMPASTIDTTSVASLDSLVLNLTYNHDSFTGDSLAPMQLSVYPLTTQLTSPVYSNIDPAEYCDLDATPIALKSYNASLQGLPDSLQSLSYKFISVRMPDEMMNDIYNKYKESPETFSSPRDFVKFFPGLYVRSCYGSGCVVNVQNTSMNLHYSKQTTTAAGEDSIYATTQTIMAVTSEIVTGNHIEMTPSDIITQGIAEGKAYVQAPAGLNLQLNLPIRQMVERFEEATGESSTKGIINSLTLTVPVESIDNQYDITPPTFLLFVRKSEMQEFFEKKQLTDNVNTFYAMYNEDDKCYTFSGLSAYINNIITQKRAGNEPTEADEEIMLVPISVYTETSTSSSTYYYYSYSEEEVVIEIVPYIEAPAMGLVDKENIKFQLVYSKQYRAE